MVGFQSGAFPFKVIHITQLSYHAIKLLCHPIAMLDFS